AFGRRRQQPSQQLARGRGSFGPTAGLRVREREVESRFVQVRVGSKSGLQRLDGSRQVAFGRLKNAEVCDQDRIVWFPSATFLQCALGSRHVVATTKARRQTEMRVRGRQSAVDGGRDLMLGPWA